MYEPFSRAHWEWLLEHIAAANLPIETENAVFDWLFALMEDPRPYPSIEDAAYREMYETEVRDGFIPGTDIDVRWVVDEKNKRFRIIRLQRPEPGS